MDNSDFDISRKALYEVIADKLEMMILSDNTKISQKLPSEQYLADSFGVSRPVIREALKILKERGLIESRQGASSVITDYSTENFAKSVSRIAHMKNATPDQIYQIRNVLEVLSVKLATENCDSNGLAALKELNRRMRECGNDMKMRSQLDVEFHAAIAKMSKNPLLEFMTSSLASLLLPLIEKSMDSVTDIDGILSHDKLISAISDGDSAKACDLMRAHLILSMRNFEFMTNS